MRKVWMVGFIIALAMPMALTGCTGTSGTPSGTSWSTQPGAPDTAGSSSGGAGIDAAALIGERCTRCHSLDRVKSAVHDADGWKSSVERMRKNGAELSDEEAAAVVGFLAGGGGAEL